MQEEKKSDENSIGANNDMKKREADGRMVLETLDRINAIRSLVVSTKQQHQLRQQNDINEALQTSIVNLRQEHTLVVERHHDILLECGLLDIDRFIEPPSSPNGNGATQDEDNASCLVQKYIQIRDAMRRRAHKISMLHRQNSLFELLFTATESDSTTTFSKPRMTQVKNMQHTLSTIQQFVKKYQSNIGSHPFLAGLYRIVHLHLNPKPANKGRCKDSSYIIRWKFRGSVLTEACQSCRGKDNENDDDELAYAREAIQMLFSFFIWIKDVDVEGGGLIMPIEEHNEPGLDQLLNSSNQNNEMPMEEQTEPILSFEVDKYISNANLRRILAVLPDPKRLDARATGTVEVLNSSASDPKDSKNGNTEDVSNLVSRKNVDGLEDEQWPWFARLEFCTLL
ncbi:hypothetical protein ACHAXR_012521 [Thalassiosira sp. AJA248-18]